MHKKEWRSENLPRDREGSGGERYYIIQKMNFMKTQVKHVKGGFRQTASAKS